MKKFMLLGVMIALLAAAVAFPALAQNRNDFDNDSDNGFFFVSDDDFEGNGFFFDGAFDDGVVGQSIGQESESGDVAIEGSVESSGDYAQQCVAPLQFGNTGNLQNAQGFVQYQSEADDIEFEGSEFSFEPAISTECDQAVQQSAAASS